MIDFGEIIRNSRKEQGFSAYRLGKMTGFSTRAITYWEEGKRTPTIESADKVLKALGIMLTIGKQSNE